MKQNIMETEEFTLLKDQLKRLNKKISDIEAFKGHFLSNVRNTIVNPFTSIVGLSEEIIKSDKENWKKVILLASMIHGEAFDLDFQLKYPDRAVAGQAAAVFREVPENWEEPAASHRKYVNNIHTRQSKVQRCYAASGNRSTEGFLLFDIIIR